MTNEKMTIHKALAELKIIDSRISKAIDEGVFCLANKHSNEKVKGISLKEYEHTMQGDYDKALDLINRRNAIKRAVVLSNAVAKVNVGSDTYTVAEAIEMKNHGIEFKEFLYDQLVHQYNKAQAEVLKNNGDDLEKRAEQYVIGIYGNKDGKTDTEDFKKAKQDFMNSNMFELVDPIKIKVKIEAFEKEINEFKAEVDAVLSTSKVLNINQCKRDNPVKIADTKKVA